MTSAPTFEQFFEAVHGFGPFPWQVELSELLADGTPPSSITAPPGLGKTASIDAWIWSLARDIALNGSARTVPLRAVFVVDRRGIVDAAYEHALRIAATLDRAMEGPSSWVAQQLRSAGHGLSSPLDVVRMRGGVSWASRWLRRPDQPALVSGTVDQFGSRFLFRGYGVSERMRPIDAAMVGTDVIAFLDEAHLSSALVSTVRDCAGMERLRGGAVSRPPVIVPMTATPGVDADASQALDVSDDDSDHPVAGPRMSAIKHARLLEVPASTAAKANSEMAAALAEHAAHSAGQGKVVLVVCNTIGVARGTHGLLSGKRFPGVEAHLSIGRGREIDKDASRAAWWRQAAAGREDRLRRRASGLVVVSTQTIEVGADLDVDTLITESAPIDSLIQRFGRVDRLGKLGTTESRILHHAVRSDPERDLVYGAATANTWRWLSSIADSSGGDGLIVDMGVADLGQRLRRLLPEERRELVAPLPKVPVLYPDLVDQLARTDPTNGVRFPVDTYLHGLNRPEVKVSVIWRADIERGDGVAARLLVAPPTTAEAVEVPLEHFKRFWTRGRSVETLTDLDVTTHPLEPDRKVESAPALLRCWAVRDGGEIVAISRPAQIRPGELLVLPSSSGGHDEYGWTGIANDDAANGAEEGLVPDVADLVSTSAPRLRIDRAIFDSLGFPRAAGLDGAMDRLERVLTDPEADDVDLGVLVDQLVEHLVAAAGVSRYPKDLGLHLDAFRGVDWSTVRTERDRGWVEAVTFASRDAESAVSDTSAASSLVVLHAPRSTGPTQVQIDAAGIVDSDDLAGTSLTGSQVPLAQHLGAVGDRARSFAESLGYSSDLVAAVEAAGRAHDLGKIDARFQTLLRAGDWLEAAAHEGHLDMAVAKSGDHRRVRPAQVPDEWAWPRGMRHEAVSLALLRQFDLPESVDRELVEHLVASHHGWSRPLFPPVLDEHPRKVEIEHDGQQLVARSDDAILDWGSVGRFHRLCRWYGWWGLALLESVLRLADMSVSEEGS